MRPLLLSFICPCAQVAKEVFSDLELDDLDDDLNNLDTPRKESVKGKKG